MAYTTVRNTLGSKGTTDSGLEEEEEEEKRKHCQSVTELQRKWERIIFAHDQLGIKKIFLNSVFSYVSRVRTRKGLQNIAIRFIAHTVYSCHGVFVSWRGKRFLRSILWPGVGVNAHTQANRHTVPTRQAYLINSNLGVLKCECDVSFMVPVGLYFSED